jgi:hypothetical protein
MKYIVLFLSICTQVTGLNAMEQVVNPCPTEIKIDLPKRTSRPQNQSPKMPRSPKTDERMKSQLSLGSFGRRSSGGSKTQPVPSNPGSQT